MEDKTKSNARTKRWAKQSLWVVKVKLNISTNARDQAIARYLQDKPSKSEALKEAAYKAISEEK